MPTITFSGNYGYNDYAAHGLPATAVIDAMTASWIRANQGDQQSRYPFNIEGAPGLVANGSAISGTASKRLRAFSVSLTSTKARSVQSI